MSNLKRDANRFLYKHRNKGIPNLMVYIGIGNAIVYLLTLILPNNGAAVASVLTFNADSILSGQVWRLFTFPLTYILEIRFFILKLLSLYVYYWVGKALEGIWGTLKVNLYYLTGILLLDLVGILMPVLASIRVYISAAYINSSLFLAIATLIPEQTVLAFFFIPIKMRWAALVHVALTAFNILRAVLPIVALGSGAFFWYVLIYVAAAPLVALINYFFYFGRNVKNLFVPPKIYRTVKKKPEPKAQPNPDWAKNYRSPAGERPYRHKCTVCGRTDTDCPDLEFRYCSKCAGYFCYCIDHINNHTHVQ